METFLTGVNGIHGNGRALLFICIYIYFLGHGVYCDFYTSENTLLSIHTMMLNSLSIEAIETGFRKST